MTARGAAKKTGGTGAGPDGADAKDALAECLLSQYKFCAAGVGLGGFYAIRKSKGIPFMVASGVSGSVADLIYGYTTACREEVERYKRTS